MYKFIGAVHFVNFVDSSGSKANFIQNSILIEFNNKTKNILLKFL